MTTGFDGILTSPPRLGNKMEFWYACLASPTISLAYFLLTFLMQSCLTRLQGEL